MGAILDTQFVVRFRSGWRRFLSAKQRPLDSRLKIMPFSSGFLFVFLVQILATQSAARGEMICFLFLLWWWLPAQRVSQSVKTIRERNTNFRAPFAFLHDLYTRTFFFRIILVCLKIWFEWIRIQNFAFCRRKTNRSRCSSIPQLSSRTQFGKEDRQGFSQVPFWPHVLPTNSFVHCVHISAGHNEI